MGAQCDDRRPLVFLTCFEPFEGRSTNASADACRLVEKPTVTELVIVELPVSFARATETIADEISRICPDLVICSGEYAGQAARFEERAANRICARIPDNDGQRPRDVPVVAGGAPELKSRMSAETCAEKAREADIQAETSDDAGVFVCNAVYYCALTACSSDENEIPCMFVHLPIGWDPHDGACAIQAAIDVGLRIIAC